MRFFLLGHYYPNLSLHPSQHTIASSTKYKILPKLANNYHTYPKILPKLANSFLPIPQNPPKIANVNQINNKHIPTSFPS
jgi:hypothetical protein